MCNSKAFARRCIDEATTELITRSEANRMNDDVDSIPMVGQPLKDRINLFVTSNVAWETQLRRGSPAFGKP